MELLILFPECSAFYTEKFCKFYRTRFRKCLYGQLLNSSINFTELFFSVQSSAQIRTVSVPKTSVGGQNLGQSWPPSAYRSYHPWRKYRIGIHLEPIRTILIYSDICIRANANHSEPIRKTFCNSFDEKR